MPETTPDTTATQTPKHAGYANGSKTLDLATWSGAVKRLLETKEERIEKRGEEEVVVRAHETDPPKNFLPRDRRMKRPGPLPLLVEESKIDKNAKTEVHDHEWTCTKDLDHDVYHLARVVVTEARRIHAKGIALRAPVFADGVWTLSVVNVLS